MRHWQGAEHDSAPLVVIFSQAAELSLFLRHLLEGDGWQVEIAITTTEALDHVRRKPSSIVLIDGELDEALPLCRQVQQERDQIPVSILVLFAETTIDHYPAFLAAGADEGLVRPIDPALILAAVQRLARQPSVLPKTAIRFGDLKIDIRERRVWRGGSAIRLTRIEFELLAVMAQRPRVIFSRQELIAGAWPKGVFVDPRTVTIHIGRLRRRMTDSGLPDLIRTVRGSGYGLDEPDAE